MSDRGLWLSYFERRDVTAMGDEWPSYIVERWERNEIGERRFTGEIRSYVAAGVGFPDARLRDVERLVIALRSVTEADPGLLAAADMVNDPTDYAIEDVALALRAALGEEPTRG